METALTPQQLEDSIENQTKIKKTLLPPPVIVEGPKSYDELYDTLFFNMPGAFQIKLMNNNNLKINVSSEHYYRILTKLLKDDRVQWHSYENKHSRSIRVIAKI
jgi:hypothetical protein